VQHLAAAFTSRQNSPVPARCSSGADLAAAGGAHMAVPYLGALVRTHLVPRPSTRPQMRVRMSICRRSPGDQAGRKKLDQQALAAPPLLTPGFFGQEVVEFAVKGAVVEAHGVSLTFSLAADPARRAPVPAPVLAAPIYRAPSSVR